MTSFLTNIRHHPMNADASAVAAVVVVVAVVVAAAAAVGAVASSYSIRRSATRNIRPAAREIPKKKSIRHSHPLYSVGKFSIFI